MSGAVKNYRAFLIEIQEDLQEVVREAEDQTWHHWAGSEDGGERACFRHYQRLLTWLSEITMRVEWHDDVKRL